MSHCLKCGLHLCDCVVKDPKYTKMRTKADKYDRIADCIEQWTESSAGQYSSYDCISAILQIVTEE